MYATDPSGLRDIIVVIWNSKGSSVGHAAAFEMNGDLILSQFPFDKDCICTMGPNKALTWPKTREREGRDPDYVFQVYIPNDKAFDSVAANHRKRPVWDWYPTKMEWYETNCVFSMTRALQAGGVVPMKDYDWPGFLADDLRGKANAKGQAWKVTPLPKVPWPPPPPPPSPAPTPKP